MAVDASALVLVMPNDTIDSIAAKVRDTGAASVQLLVPDNTQVLQARSGFAQLRRSLERDGISLLVISSDERTLDAAQSSQIDTMGVQGTRVTLPDNGGPSNRYATQVIGSETREPRSTSQIDAQDAAFLDALDQVPAKDRYAGLDDADADLYAALDDLSDAIQYGETPDRRAPSADDDFAAALDELSELAGDERAPRRSHPGAEHERALGAEPRRRVRPEDIDLDDDDVRRQRSGRRQTTQSGRASATPGRGATGARRGTTTSGRMLDPDEIEEYAPRRGIGTRLLPLLIALAVILVIAIGIWWLLNSRATIIVSPPAAQTQQETFENEIIPLNADGAAPNAAAVQAAPVSAEAEYTGQGTITAETSTPTSRAQGTITIFNKLAQPVPLDAGTEFVGQNAEGQEVRFTLDVPAVVPPAVTSTSPTGTSTTNGSILVAITARSPGSASNIGENLIRQMIIPGQEPLDVTITTGGNFIVQHGPIAGGAEEAQRVVTQEDVNRILGETLTGLYNTGFMQLRARIDETRGTIDDGTVSPNYEELGNPANYELVAVTPAVGQIVPADNPTFSVTVRANFNGLAVPNDPAVPDTLTVVKQLQTVVPEYFNQKLSGQFPCPRNEISFDLLGWHWDGSKLTVDARINCMPSGQLPADIESQVRSAVRGQSVENAQASLEQLRRAGTIGNFQLPDGITQFPGQDFLLTVVQQPLAPADPEQAEPTVEPTTVQPSQTP